MPRRVFITGLGAVTPLGVGVVPLWEGLVAGRSALGPIRRFDPSGFPCRLGGEIQDFSAREFMPKNYRKAIKVMARDIEIAIVAAKLAVEDARLITRAHAEGGQTVPTYAAERMGCQIGAGLIVADAAELASAFATAVPHGASAADVERNGGFDLRTWGRLDGSGGMNNLPPLWMLKYLPNMLACHVTILHGCEGPSNTLTCTEASGLLCIGEGSRVIERGAADATISGGAECRITLMSFLRWGAAGHLAATENETDGARVIKPFDPASPGTLPGEGGGLVILEAESSARARNATLYAEVVGFGAGQSGPCSLPPFYAEGCMSSEGLEAAVRGALDDAKLSPADIDAIVPQATGIPAMDQGERDALTRVFGPALTTLPAVTLAPNIGNLYAGHASVQVAVAALCLQQQRLPARIHAGQPRGLDVAACEARPAKLRNILICAAATGGQNAAIVLRRAD